MKIGELAKIANCTVETIRYYEKENLMPKPLRTENNYRQYTNAHIERLRFIRNCRTLDLNHNEIRHLLTMMDPANGQCEQVNEILDEHIQHVQIRISQLQQLEQQLTELHKHCHRRCQQGQENTVCGILQGLSKLDYENSGAVHTHDKHDFSHN